MVSSTENWRNAEGTFGINELRPTTYEVQLLFPPEVPRFRFGFVIVVCDESVPGILVAERQAVFMVVIEDLWVLVPRFFVGVGGARLVSSLPAFTHG